MAGDIKKEELEFEEPRSLIPEGVYTADCVDYDGPKPYLGTRKIYLIFKTLKGPYSGTQIFMPFNIGFGKIPRGSRYRHYWALVNNNKPWTRNAQGSPRIFLNKTYRILVKTVKPSVQPRVKLVNDPSMGKVELPKGEWYSVVDHFELIDLPDNEDD